MDTTKQQAKYRQGSRADAERLVKAGQALGHCKGSVTFQGKFEPRPLIDPGIHRRRHSTLDYGSPMPFEKICGAAQGLQAA